METHKPIRITFALDEKDAAYFRSLYQEAKKNAENLDPSSVTESARAQKTPPWRRFRRAGS